MIVHIHGAETLKGYHSGTFCLIILQPDHLSKSTEVQKVQKVQIFDKLSCCKVIK